MILFSLINNWHQRETPKEVRGGTLKSFWRELNQLRPLLILVTSIGFSVLPRGENTLIVNPLSIPPPQSTSLWQTITLLLMHFTINQSDTFFPIRASLITVVRGTFLPSILT